jgi:hypothetical protein
LTAQDLGAAMTALANVGVEAGVEPGAARAEGAALAASLLRGRPGEVAAWSEACQCAGSAWAAAAATGRQRGHEASPLLGDLVRAANPQAGAYARALAAVAAEASTLVEDPTLADINAAGLAARAQLAAVPPGLDRATPAGHPDSLPGESPRGAQTKPEQAPTVDELLAQLDALVGLSRVKSIVHHKVALLRLDALRRAAGLKLAEVSHHLVFVGNAGTGKTTVARLLGQIYRALGLLREGHLVETDRSGLVAGYEGQSALKATEVIKSALGGLLFIDEAYALALDQFGAEVIATLLKAMEDHRADLVVVVAGYPDEMGGFLASNPGLSSRFPTTVEFEDYSDDELTEIFVGMCRGNDYEPDEDCLARVRLHLAGTPRGRGFGNGRWVRNLYESAVDHQAWRMRALTAPTVEQLRALTVSDVEPERDHS